MGRGKPNPKLIEADQREAERKHAEDQMDKMCRRLKEEEKAEQKNPHELSTSEGSSGGSPARDRLPETQNKFRVLFAPKAP